MNNELLLRNKKYTDTLTEQTRSRSQETLEFKFKKPMDNFAFSRPINITEEKKWLLTVKSFEATISVFIICHGKGLLQN